MILPPRPKSSVLEGKKSVRKSADEKVAWCSFSKE